MKIALQLIEHLGRFERLQLVEDLRDEFASEMDQETRPEVLDELERRAAWRDAHPSQRKSLAQIAQIAQSLGVRLGSGCLYLKHRRRSKFQKLLTGTKNGPKDWAVIFYA